MSEEGRESVSRHRIERANIKARPARRNIRGEVTVRNRRQGRDRMIRQNIEEGPAIKVRGIHRGRGAKQRKRVCYLHGIQGQRGRGISIVTHFPDQ